MSTTMTMIIEPLLVALLVGGSLGFVGLRSWQAVRALSQPRTGTGCSSCNACGGCPTRPD